MKIGTQDIDYGYVGGTGMDALYLGTTKLYPIDYEPVINSMHFYRRTTVTPYDSTAFIGINGNQLTIRSSAQTAIQGDFIFNAALGEIGANAFSGNTGLQGVVFPHTLTRINTRAFFANSYMEYIWIPDSVTYIGTNAFQNCTSAITLCLGNGVTTVGSNAFNGCSALKSISIPPQLKTLGTSFLRNCSGLDSIVIPATVTTINDYAFNGCTSLTEIECEGTTPPSVSGSSTFLNSNNCPIYVPESAVNAYKSAWSSVASRIQARSVTPASRQTVIHYTSHNGAKIYPYRLGFLNASNNNTFVYSNTYENGIGTLVINGVVDKINDYAFAGTQIETIEIPDATRLGTYVFFNCPYLKSVSLPSSIEVWDGSADGRLFKYCFGLQNVKLGNTTISDLQTQTFMYCINLQNLELPNGTTYIPDSLVRACTNLKRLVIPASVTSIGELIIQESGVEKIFCFPTTPPTLTGTRTFEIDNNCPIYVPSGSVNAYKSAWSAWASRIQAMP